jgi:hypothetical protein
LSWVRGIGGGGLGGGSRRRCRQCPDDHEGFENVWVPHE